MLALLLSLKPYPCPSTLWVDKIDVRNLERLLDISEGGSTGFNAFSSGLKYSPNVKTPLTQGVNGVFILVAVVGFTTAGLRLSEAVLPRVAYGRT